MLSLVIPAYNEAANLPGLVERLLGMMVPDLEIILVDNGSTDETPAVLRRLVGAGEVGPIRTVRVPENRGYGHGMMAGVAAARGDVIAWTHADLQTDVQDIVRGYQRFLASPVPERTFLKGARQHRPILDRFFTCGMGAFASLATGQRLQDVNAQPKMFHRHFLTMLRQPPSDFSLDLYVLYLARRHGLQLLELPVAFRRREHGEAKGGGGSWRNRWRLLRRTAAYIWQLRRDLRAGVR